MRRPCCESAKIQHGVKFARPVQGEQVVGATNGPTVDEDLRHRCPSTRTLDCLFAGGRTAWGGNFAIAYPFLPEHAQGAGAIRTPRLGVDLDLRHVTRVGWSVPQHSGGSRFRHAMITHMPRIPALRCGTPLRPARPSRAIGVVAKASSCVAASQIAPALRIGCFARRGDDSRPRRRRWRRPDCAIPRPCRGAGATKPKIGGFSAGMPLPGLRAATAADRTAALTTRTQSGRDCPWVCIVFSRAALRRRSATEKLREAAGDCHPGRRAAKPVLTPAHRIQWCHRV
jgi:hypothetical protein